VRPARPFRELLQEALAAAKEGRTDRFGHAFREEAERHARLGPRGEDPVAQALALGRQALRHLARGEREDACEKLSQALELHPSLGGGLALDLAEALCGESGPPASPGAPRPPRGGSPRAPTPGPPGPPARRVLGGGPEGSAPDPLLPEKRPGGSRGPTPTSGKALRGGPGPPSPVRGSPSPTGPCAWEESQGEKQVRTFLLQTSREPPEPTELRRWVAPGLGLEVREAGRRLYLRVLPEFRKAYPQAALLVLEAGRARVLAPLLPAAGSLPLPVDLKGGADLVAEVWSWEDLTPETLAELLREGYFYPDLLEIWLLYGMGQGLIPREVVVEALRRLERGS
jgi:hypothetical protein